VIRLLSETDDPSGFSCGSAELDRYLEVHALANLKLGVSATYVHADQLNRVDGFLTLAGTSIRSAEANSAGNLPRYPLPALLVARLAVDSSAQGQGIGRRLLAFALEEALIMHRRIGCIAVVVDAKLSGVSFYEHFGFEPVVLANPAASTMRMVIEIGSIIDALA
jgi:GNAT superfamily N-acetyltransferase